MGYELDDELNFVAWIAFNGLADHKGAIKTPEQIEEDGTPKPRTTLQRIDFLNDYVDQFYKRDLPNGWTTEDRGELVAYITLEVIPMLRNMRVIQLGDVV